MKNFGSVVAQLPNLRYSTQRSFVPLLPAFHCVKEDKLIKFITNRHDYRITLLGHKDLLQKLTGVRQGLHVELF